MNRVGKKSCGNNMNHVEQKSHGKRNESCWGGESHVNISESFEKNHVQINESCSKKSHVKGNGKKIT